jgi:hypothetical protein
MINLAPEHCADLKKSGLSDDTIREAGIKSLVLANAKKLLGFKLHPGIQSLYKIPYFDLEGKELNFFRVKVFPSYKDKEGHTVKYLQPKNTKPQLYMPPLINYSDMACDPSTKFGIIEGEKKLLAALQDGMSAFGLGGVWSWVSKDNGVSKPIKDFDSFEWKGREEVLIVGDSDIWLKDKEQALMGLYALGMELVNRGVHPKSVKLVQLPNLDSGKTGFDDFRIFYNGNWRNEFYKLEQHGINDNLFTKVGIWHMNWKQRRSEITDAEALTAANWQEPIPFNNYSILPEFPIDILPSPGREMVERVAIVNQVDAGLPASIYLAVLSTCLSKKATVNLITHSEPVNVYTCTILDSGERKSSTLNLMAKPIYEYQEINKLDIQENSIEPGDGDMTSSDKDINEPVYVVDDITTEALGKVMAENNERMSVISSEGGIFGIMAGRYNENGGTNFDMYLKGHSGDPWSTHRIGRGAQSMDSPSLTMCLTVQRDVIREIGKNKRFKGRGLLARIYYCLCKSQVGYRRRQRIIVPETLLNEYREHIFELMEIPLELHELKMTPEAQDAWDEFYNDIENDMKPGQQLAAITDWGSKLPGAVARIAGLLHYAEHGKEAINKPISVNIVNGSAVIGAYYREHALATLGLMNEDPQIESAKKVLEYLILHKPDSFKGRDVLRHKNAFKNMKDVTPGLELLVERNYIREVKTKLSIAAGRPEATTYEVNPKVKTL